MRILWMSAIVKNGWLAGPVAKTSEPMSMLREVTTPSNGAAMLAKPFCARRRSRLAVAAATSASLTLQIGDLLVDRLLGNCRRGPQRLPRSEVTRASA